MGNTKVADEKLEALRQKMFNAQERRNAHEGRCRKCEEDTYCQTIHNLVDAEARAQDRYAKASGEDQ